MKKIFFILKEMLFMLKKHKLYIVAPVFILLALLAILIYQVGPAVIITFIYAGI
jgi:hypothetical protein